MSFKVGRQKTGWVNILPPTMVPNGPPECCFTFHLIVCLVSMVLHLKINLILINRKHPLHSWVALHMQTGLLLGLYRFCVCVFYSMCMCKCHCVWLRGNSTCRGISVNVCAPLPAPSHAAMSQIQMEPLKFLSNSPEKRSNQLVANYHKYVTS